MMSSSKEMIEISRQDAHDHQDNVFRPWKIGELEQCGREGFDAECVKNDDRFQVLYEHEEKGEDLIFRRLYEVGGAGSEKENGGSDDDNDFQPFSAHALGSQIVSVDDSSEGKNPLSGSTHFHDAGAPHTDDHGTADDAFSPLISPDGEMVMEDGAASHGATLDGPEADGSDSASSDAAAEPPNASTVSPEERDAVLETAFNSGFEEGKTQGFESGQQEGRETGYQEGFDKGEQEGYDAGLVKGEADGKMLSDAKAQELMASLEDICQKADQAWQTMVQKSESQILSLISKIAEKVVFATVDLSEEVVRGSVLQALSVMPEPEEIVLNIAPEDYEYIEMVKEDFFEAFKSLKHVSVLSNPAVGRGGCKIESSKGQVETDVSTRLEAITASMLAAQSNR